MPRVLHSAAVLDKPCIHSEQQRRTIQDALDSCRGRFSADTHMHAQTNYIVITPQKLGYCQPHPILINRMSFSITSPQEYIYLESGKFENLDLPADTSKLNDVQCESDNTFVRAKLSTTIVSDTPGPKKPVIVSDTPRKPVLQSTPTPPTEKIDYVLTLPKKFDRNFAHIFFRKSGIYLVAVSIEDMMEDPAIEFENLCYWLRQIQTYVEPESIKRVIVVGIHNTLHTEVVQLHNVSTLLSKLDRAIHEAEFSQIMEVSCRNLTVCVNFAEPDHKNSQLLHTCVNKCMDVMKAKSECYEKSFFSHTYQPFTQLNRTLLKISRIMAIIATTEEIMDCYNFTHPRFKETLANYSQACISAEGECK